MGALIGFVFGYVVGAKAGPEGLEELRRAWQTIVQSEELKGLAATVTTFVQGALAQSGEAVAEQLGRLTAGNGDVVGETLRRMSGGGDLLAALRRLTESPELRELVSAGTALVGAALAQATVRGPNEGAAGRA